MTGGRSVVGASHIRYAIPNQDAIAWSPRNDSRATSSAVLALADGPNDVELLTHAAVGLVPAVAHPVALDLATAVIPSAADGGWAAVLDHV